MSLHLRELPAGFIEPCLPTSARSPPSDEGWLHEIKHDGFRVIVRKNDKRVRLYSRSGNDLTDRFPLIVEAVSRSSCERQRSRVCLGRRCSRAYSRAPRRVCGLMRISRRTVPLYSSTPVRWGSKVSSQNGKTRATFRDGRCTGPSQRTRMRRQ